ncbi:MAG: SBBP repeat-containing protein, partial [Ramlibacter sp.]|nr:SBBP repeat-containing protein [Ramlibacter sp.]
MGWFRRTDTRRPTRLTPVAEAMEPRLLYSADLAAGLMLAATLEPAAEQRTLSETGEYETAVSVSAATGISSSAIAIAYAATPLVFEAVPQMTAESADFVARGSGYGIALDSGGANLTFATSAGQRTVQLQLAGAHADVKAEGGDLLASTSNYLLGSNASQWRTAIANYGSVVYREVYDGVDVRYYGNQRQLEYDFIVAAGADAGAISLRFGGVERMEVVANGDLVLRVAGTDSEVRFKAPVSYQRGEWGLEAVASRYEIRADGSIGFVLGDYDHARELVIDPVLDYATYFGSAGIEAATGVAVDSAVNVYITGRTTGGAGTLASNGGPGGGTDDIFVTKFSPDLSTLIWSTRIGGTGDEQANAIAVDAAGSVVVTGWTQSANFPTLAASQGAISGTQDAVVFKLDATGTALVFSTYFGGTAATDSGNAVVLDAVGNVYAAGQVSYAGGVVNPLHGTTDNAFLNKYSAVGAVLYQTQYGGLQADSATGVAVDTLGGAYLVGNTRSNNLTIVNGHDITLNGADDGFLARFDVTGGSVVYSTYVGGSRADTSSAVAIDGAGLAYVVGNSTLITTADFVITPGALQPRAALPNFTTAGYLRVVNTGLVGAASLVYSTYLGGSNNVAAMGPDQPSGVVLSGGRVVVVGHTDSSNFPITADALQSTNTGKAMFVAVINPAGAGSADLDYGTYYGSGMAVGGVTANASGVYIAASTSTAGLSKPGGFRAAPLGQAALIVHVNLGTTNAAPVNTVPVAQAVNEDTALVFG